MKRLTRQEWTYLNIGAGLDEVTRAEADRLLAIADRAGQDLALKSAEGERVLQDGRNRLRAQQTVGIIAAPGITLEILPKIDDLDAPGVRRRLIHMIAVCEGFDLSAEEQAELETQDRDLLEIFVALFARRLTSALRSGVLRGYRQEEDDRRALRGRLMIERQFTRFAGRSDLLACRFDEFSPDIPLNRIIAAAAQLLVGLTRVSATRQSLEYCLGQLEGISPLAAGLLPKVHFDRMNRRFASAHALARLFLMGRYQTTSGGGQAGQAILFRMNVLFEAYITHIARRFLTPEGWTVTAQKPQRPALWRGAAGLFQMKPDIVLQRGDCTLILDTKWKRLIPEAQDPKRGISQADVYQMMAYAAAYEASAVALIYPHSDGNAEFDLLRIGASCGQIAAVTLPMEELGHVPQRLRHLVNDLSRGSNVGETGMDIRGGTKAAPLR